MRVIYGILACLILPSWLFGAAVEIGATDIVERTINFVIFAAILYYLLANKLKEYFKARRDLISNELDKVQENLKRSKQSREQAEKRLEEAKRRAEDILVTARKEALLSAKRVEEQAKVEIGLLAKHFEEAMALEKRQAERAVVEQVIGELVEGGAERFTKDVYGEILLKRVS